MLNKTLNFILFTCLFAVAGFYIYNNYMLSDTDPAAPAPDTLAIQVQMPDTLYAVDDTLPAGLSGAPDEKKEPVNLTPKSGVIPVTWDVLKGTQFKEKYYEELGESMLFPEFGDTVKMLNGKLISIKGYIIPLDEETGVYALSAFPNAACFFCGGAGPETVMGLKFKGNKRKNFLLDMRCTFKGRLRLNDTDVDDFNYILENAELIFED